MTDKDDRVECRTPTEGRSGTTSIPKWKYECLRDVILAVVQEAGSDGLRFSQLKDAVRSRLTEDQLYRLGSLGWHVTTVKLNMEVEGELIRLDGAPQRLVTS